MSMTGQGWRDVPSPRVGARTWIYPWWKRALATRLREGSELLPTRRGVVEVGGRGRETPWVVGVHGSPGGYDQLPAIFPGFPGAEYQLLNWSRPGYLRTPLSLGPSFEEQADLMAELLDALGCARVAVFAFSGGGPVAVHFAARHPARIWALILESAVTQRLSWPKAWPLDSALGNWLTSLAAQVWPRRALTGLLRTESALEAVVARDRLERAMQDERRARVVCGLLRSASPAVLRRAGLRNDVARIRALEPLPFDAVRAPTLILHGARDAQVPIESAERAVRLIPQAELVRVPDAFHLLSLAENGDELGARRLEFLRRHRPQDAAQRRTA